MDPTLLDQSFRVCLGAQMAEEDVELPSAA